MHLAPILIVLMATFAINQIEGCPTDPPGYMELRKYPRSSRLSDYPTNPYPSYGNMGPQYPSPQNERPDLRGDVGRLIRDLGVIFNQ